MKNFWTWRKVIVFLIIIGAGIFGIILADEHDFLSGRTEPQTVIGNGVADPLVNGNVPKIIQGSKVKTTTRTGTASVPVIDGVKQPCTKNC